jgi:hypothetical protein
MRLPVANRTPARRLSPSLRRLETPLILASAYDVLALTLATGLSVYKPRRRRAPWRGPETAVVRAT